MSLPSLQNRYRIPRMRMFTSAPKSLALALVLISNALAQQPILSGPPNTTGDEILGFESTQDWTVRSSSASTSISSSIIRTQGNRAYAVANPAPGTTITSAVPFTTAALAGLKGSAFQVDVMPPASGGTGSLELVIELPEKGLTGTTLQKVSLGQTSLSGLPAGFFSTLKFAIPEALHSVVASANPTAIGFIFTLNVTTSSGTYVFDNLRVLTVSPVTGKLGVAPPPNFGASVNLVATGDVQATQTFPIGPVQVPESFRLAVGTAGVSTLKLALGHDGSPTYACTYTADTSDQTGQTYQLTSCTGGVKAGDLVGVNFASLAIDGGTSEMKVQADLARTPVGDLVGTGIIPAMPTFWGKSDSCVPAPASGKAISTNAGCTAQVAEASQIATDYFNKVSTSQAPFNFIAAPPAQRALNHGNAMGNPTPPSTPQQTSDTPINQSGHANQGGDFDAYWLLTGDFNTKVTPATGASSAHLDVEFGGHIVAFGGDVDVADVKVTADTTTTGTITSAGAANTATGSVSFFLFGEQVPGGGSANLSTGFNFNALQASQEFNLPQIDVWIFSVQVGATASATLNVTGSLAPNGFNVTVDPQVSMGVHISGGVNLGIASGEVDAKINLLQVEAPVNAEAELVVNAATCKISIEIGLNAQVTVSSLSGEIDLVASFGPCPFCYSNSWPLVKWAALESTTQQLYSVGPVTLAAISLPPSICKQIINATITVPAANAQTGIPYPLFASALIPDPTIPNLQADCNVFTWSVTPNETISGSGCTATITFANVGPHTVTLSINPYQFEAGGGMVAGSGTQTVNVTALTPGAHIIALNRINNAIAPFEGQSVQVTGPTIIQLTGGFVGATGAVNYAWTLTDGSGHTTGLPSQALPNNQSQATSNLISSGTFTVTMKATDSNGNSLGSASMTVTVNQNIVRQ